MKIALKLTLAALGGAAVAATGVGLVRAETAPTPVAYVVANLQEIKDAATYGKYRAAVGGTEALYGGHAIVVAKPEALDQSTPPKGTIVILAFPSLQKLHEWWNSPEYSAIRPLREKSTVGQNYAVEGLAQP